MKRSVSCLKTPKDTRNPNAVHPLIVWIHSIVPLTHEKLMENGAKGGRRGLFDVIGFRVPAVTKAVAGGRCVFFEVPTGGGVCPVIGKINQKFKVFRNCPLILGTRLNRDFQISAERRNGSSSGESSECFYF